MNQSELETTDGYVYHQKPWYTAYDFEELRQRMTPDELQLYREATDAYETNASQRQPLDAATMKRMRDCTVTLLREMKRGQQKDIRVECPSCHGSSCCIKVDNGLFHCWKCGTFHGQLRELARLHHDEGTGIDTAYYQRAKNSTHRDPDYTPLVATDYQPLDPKALRQLVELTEEGTSSPASPGTAASPNPVSPAILSLRRSVQGYLTAMGISLDTAKRAGVRCAYMSRKVDDSRQEDPQGYEQVPAIAYCNTVFGRIVNVKMRTVSLDPLTGAYRKDFFQLSPTKPCAPYGIDCINPLRPDAQPIDRLIVTEGEKDLLTLRECGFPYVISVASGASTELQKSHEAFEEWIAQAEEIVVCGDTDRPGRGLVRRLLAMYADRAVLAELPPDTKDISEVYARYGAAVVRRIIEGARELGVEEVYTAREHEDEICQVMLGRYDHGYSVGMGELTDHVLHLTSSGGLIVVTGVPNSGKTDFLNCLMSHLIFQRQKRVAFFSFELPDKAKHFDSIARVGLGEENLLDIVLDPLTHQPDAHKVETRLRPVIRYLDRHMVDFRMETSLPTPTYIIRKAEQLRRKQGLDFLVVDPYMFVAVDEGKERLSETQQVKEMLTRIQAWSRKHGVWTVVVAHPRIQHQDGTQSDYKLDLYSVSGSANWANLADFFFAVKRFHDPARGFDYSAMVMMKVRDQQLSHVGSVFYTRQPCGRYDERQSEEECQNAAEGMAEDNESWI